MRAPVALILFVLFLAAWTMPHAGAAGPADDAAAAEKAIQSGDLPTAMRLFRRAADAGHAPAMVRLADILDTAEQDAEAVALYRRAAVLGDPGGEFGLGRMLVNGEGVEKDVSEGMRQIRRAADKGYLPAMESLAVTYRRGGFGIAPDPGEAARWDARVAAMRPAPSPPPVAAPGKR